MLVSELFQNIVVIAFIIIALLSNYSFCFERHNILKCYFHEKETQCWKGLLALFIVLDHLWMQHNMISLALFHESAVIVVSIYFFFSGYGVGINTLKRPNYMGLAFWRKRVVCLILPMIIVDFAMFIWKCFYGMEMNGSIILDYLTGKTLFNVQTWYIRELMICYLIFNVMSKMFSEPKKIVVGCLICITLMNLVLFMCGYGYQWYGSSYGFIIGIYFAYSGGGYANARQKKISLSRLTVIAFLLTGLFSLIYKIVGRDVAWNILITRNAMTFMATILFICFLSVCTIKSRSFDRISQISMEIYLIHILVIEIYVKLGLEIYPIILVASVMVTVVVLGHLVHRCFKLMRNII